MPQTGSLGRKPITNASFVLILVKIFRESRVFPLEIHNWSCLPEADKMVAKCMVFFTKAYENPMEESLQGALTANTTKVEPANQSAKAVSTLPNKSMGVLLDTSPVPTR